MNYNEVVTMVIGIVVMISFAGVIVIAIKESIKSIKKWGFKYELKELLQCLIGAIICFGAITIPILAISGVVWLFVR